jgi:hypothetical protein
MKYQANNKINIEIKDCYLKVLKRLPTDYESYIYYNAMICGFSRIQLENILKDSSEYKYKFLSKKDIIKNFNYSEKIKKNKLALCISGHIRNFNNTYLNLFNNLVSKLDIDIFIHTWDVIGTQVKRSDSIGIGYNIIPINNEFINLIKKINPKKYLIENFSSKINTFKVPSKIFMYGAPVNSLGVVNSTARPENIISQLYSIDQSYSLLEKYEQENKINYDIIIKMRFDFSLDCQIPEEEILNCIDKNIIYTLNKNKSTSSFDNCSMCKENFHKGIHDNIISDLFLFGNNKIMKHYMSLYKNYYDLYLNLTNNISFNDINLSYELENIKFIGDLNTAIYRAPCFFPERLLMDYLSDIRIFESNIFGQVLR